MSGERYREGKDAAAGTPAPVIGTAATAAGVDVVAAVRALDIGPRLYVRAKLGKHGYRRLWAVPDEQREYVLDLVSRYSLEAQL